MKKYKIICDEEQLQNISNALEIVARLNAGHFIPFLHMFAYRKFDYEKVDNLLIEIKKEIFPELPTTANYGIYQKEIYNLSKINYDMYRVINYYLFRNDDDLKHSLYHDRLLRASDKEFIKIEEIEKENEIL